MRQKSSPCLPAASLAGARNSDPPTSQILTGSLLVFLRQPQRLNFPWPHVKVNQRAVADRSDADVLEFGRFGRLDGDRKFDRHIALAALGFNEPRNGVGIIEPF